MLAALAASPGPAVLARGRPPGTPGALRAAVKLRAAGAGSVRPSSYSRTQHRRGILAPTDVLAVAVRPARRLGGFAGASRVGPGVTPEPSVRCAHGDWACGRAAK